MSTSLQLYSDYSRQDVHDIFSPDTVFTPQAGTWGLQGIVDVPDRPGDYVFFVTFGQAQGDHEFDEFVTEDGVLSWQSQPRQSLDDRRIREFIDHEEEVSNIHLFLRTQARRDYTYLGRLKYLEHDTTRERPVHFQWQILDWPPGNTVLGRIGLELTRVERVILRSGDIDLGAPKHKLLEQEKPLPRRRGRPKAGKKNAVRRPDYLANHAANQELGLLGELLVIQMEKERLIAIERPDLADQVRHVSVQENDTAGYDVLSFDFEGKKQFIEVKTTRGPADSDFFISANELVFAATHASSYRLYRLYDYVDELDSALYYVIAGDIRKNGLLKLIATNYKVGVQRDEI
jgi:hypothetical protein